MRLSIIIALYNTEKYIEKCIRSIFFDNPLPLQQYEVIVINDGSTDNSKNLVQDLMSEFSNLILINKKNGGQSTARNIGFEIAKGNYIFCLDSDDSLNGAELVEALKYAEENNLEMLPVFYQNYAEDHTILKQKIDNYPIFNKIMKGGEFMNKYVVSGSMWRYFYKNSVLKKFGLRLTEGVYHEDEEFIIKFLSYTKSIAYQKHLVYNHVKRGNSTVNNRNKSHRLRLLKDLSIIIEKLLIHRDSFDENSTEFIGISKKIEQLIVSLFLRMKEDGLNFEESKLFILKLENLGLYPIKIKYLGLKFKLATMCFNNEFFNKCYYR